MSSCSEMLSWNSALQCIKYAYQIAEKIDEEDAYTDMFRLYSLFESYLLYNFFIKMIIFVITIERKA